MEEQLLTAIISAASSIALALIYALSKRVSKKIDTFLEGKQLADNIKSKKYLVDIAVEATQQMWENENGEEKLNKAKAAVSRMLKEEGLDISEEQLTLFIESSVHAMKTGIKDATTNEEDEVIVISDGTSK